MTATSHMYYSYHNSCFGEGKNTDDYSVAMLDMIKNDLMSGFLDSLPRNDMLLLYQDADTAIYDAKFLENITANFPQFKHILATVNPNDPKKIKEVYASIVDNQRRQQLRLMAHDRHRKALEERQPRERIISVFDGSYDDRTMNEEIVDSDAFEEDASGDEPTPSMDVCEQSQSDEYSEQDDEDPEYIDKSYQRWLVASARRSAHGHKRTCGGKTRPLRGRQPSSSTPRDKEADDDDGIPVLIPDTTSSPELKPISTPTDSPMATPHVRNAEPTDRLAEVLDIPDPRVERNISEAGKTKVASSGYDVASDKLIVASWGSDNGRSCRPLSHGGFECSCSHRTTTMGDMTRHWMSKRHSDAAFGCKGCGKVYTRDDALKRHMRRSDECAKKARRCG